MTIAYINAFTKLPLKYQNTIGKIEHSVEDPYKIEKLIQNQKQVHWPPTKRKKIR